MPDATQSLALVLSGRYEEPIQQDTAESRNHLVALNVISLSFGAVSLVATIVTLYWFVRMRGTFRHNLIILLILGDFMKSLWFVVFPVQSFARDNRNPNHIFCQVSGFGLALGIEATDCAVFLIAIQVAVTVFHPQHSRSGVGLEPYRLYVYALWVAIPALLASLIFIDGGGYRYSGQYCYVPNYPVWRRLVLTWAPRYAIFLTILSLAVCISVYVRLLLRRYSKHEGEWVSASLSSSSAQASRDNDLEFNTSRARAQERIRRQLRLLFVYPLVYLAIWTCPFILHIIRLRTHIQDPFPAVVLALVSLCGAGTVDCAVFMASEKPWRCVRAGFWKSLGWRLHICGPTEKFQGRSREEMLADAVMAERRRREEVAMERLERRPDSERRWRTGTGGGSKGAQNWWEVDGVAEVEEERWVEGEGVLTSWSVP